MREVIFGFRENTPLGRKSLAFLARLKKSKRPAQKILNAEIIEELAKLKDWTQPKLTIRKVKGRRVRPRVRLIYPEYIRKRAIANDKDFFEQLGRAIYLGRGRKRKLKRFLLNNWDTFRLGDKPTQGLKVFTDEAVVSLLTLLGIEDDGYSLGAYRELRKSLALTPEKPPKVRHVYERNGNLITDSR